MWDILDFASSSSPLEATESPSPTPARKKRKTAEQSTGRSTRQRTLRQQGDLEDTLPGARPANSTIEELVEPMVNDESISDWQFADRGGSNVAGSLVPDIPDWMIFGDFMSEHL